MNQRYEATMLEAVLVSPASTSKLLKQDILLPPRETTALQYVPRVTKGMQAPQVNRR